MDKGVLSDNSSPDKICNYDVKDQMIIDSINPCFACPLLVIGQLSNIPSFDHLTIHILHPLQPEINNSFVETAMLVLRSCKNHYSCFEEKMITINYRGDFIKPFPTKGQGSSIQKSKPFTPHSPFRNKLISIHVVSNIPYIVGVGLF